MSIFRQSSSLLLNDRKVIKFLPKLGKLLGVDEAIILQQIQYWIEHNEVENKNFHDGRTWVYNSYEAWEKQFEGCYSTRTIRRAISKLEKMGILVTGNYNKLKMDKTKWYSIDYDALDAEFARAYSETEKSAPSGQNGQMRHSNVSEQKKDEMAEKPRHDASGQNGHKDVDRMAKALPEITRENKRVVVVEGPPAASLANPADEKLDKVKTVYKEQVGDLTDGMEKALGEWAKIMEDALIVDALVRTGKYAKTANKAGYFEGIVTNRIEKGILTMAALEASKPKPADEKPAKTKRYSKPAVKVENIPDHIAKPDDSETPPDDSEAWQELNARIKKLKSSGKEGIYS